MSILIFLAVWFAVSIVVGTVVGKAIAFGTR